MHNRTMKKACAILGALLLLGMALVLGACAPQTAGPAPIGVPTGPRAGKPGALPASTDTVGLLKVGQERLTLGRYLLAVDAFRAALAANPSPYQISQIRLGLARAYEGSRQRELAVEQLRRMPATGGDTEALVRGELLRAELESKLGQLSQASVTLRHLLSTPPRPLRTTERLRALELMAEVQTSLGQYGQATGTLLQVAGMRGELSDAMRVKLTDVSERASAAELEAQLDKVRAPELKAVLLISLARAQMREGDLEGAAATAAKVKSVSDKPAVAAKVKALQEQIMQARLVNPVAVGALLPLTGPWSQPGREVLAALELGLGVYENLTGNAPVLYIADSKGKALDAVSGVDLLVDKYKVMAIIGPMGAAASLAAARQAQIRQVPIISLARVDGVVRAGDYVFQNSLTPARQMQGLLIEAMNLRGKKRFAVLAPDNSYGRGFAALLRAGVVARDGQVTRVVFFDPKAKDYTPFVKDLLKLPPGKYRPGDKDAPQPVIDFEALFIPDGPQAVAMAASQLRYFDVSRVLLMGTDLWHDPALLELAGRDVQGAIFPGLFDPKADNPVADKFVENFKAAMKRTPTLLEAQGFDAALALRHLITQPQPPRTRPALRQALTGVRDLPGACGPLSVGAQRTFETPVTIFTVRGQAYRPVQPADRVEPEPAPETPQTGQPGQPPVAGQGPAQPAPNPLPIKPPAPAAGQ